MKKLYTAFLLVLLAALLGVGIYSLADQDAAGSASEKREFVKPEFSVRALLDGTYIPALEQYYSDTFPGRETLLNANRTLNKFYYYSGSGEDSVLIVNQTDAAAHGGEALDAVQKANGQTAPEAKPPAQEAPAEPPSDSTSVPSDDPQEEPQPVEETPEEPEEQPVEEPEETPVSEDTPGSQNGNDETATQEMIQKVSGMAWTFTGENIQRDYCPEPLNGFGVVLMAFSNQPKAPAALTETAEPMPENGADNTAEDQTENAGAAGTEPAENGDAAAADAQTPVADTQTPSEEQEKYAILFRENDTVDQDELIEKLRQIPDASLILRHNGLTMIVYGDAEMQMLALTAMDAIYPAGETTENAASQTEDTQEANAETAEKDVLLLRVEDVLLDITEAFQTADSWRVVQEFSTDGIPMAFAAQAQALTVEPALTIVCDMECVFIYDFREAQEEAETLMTRAKDADLHVLDVDGFVLVSEKN